MNVIRKVGLILLGLAAGVPAFACGPWFPNRLLDGGDAAVLVAPYASFSREIERMGVIASTAPAQPRTKPQSYAEQAATADLLDLQAALAKSGGATKNNTNLVGLYTAAREKLYPQPKETSGDHDEDGTKKPIAIEPGFQLPAGLPVEFSDYLQGARFWTQANTNAAVEAWRKLLERPLPERQFKSTWAAFMLGRALLATDALQARSYFRQVRLLAQSGFADSLGLAAASLGWEAKTYYDRGEYFPAMELYLQQAASGDPSAIVSLEWAVAKVIKLDQMALESFARDVRMQRVITAYVLQRHNGNDMPETSALDKDVVNHWLATVEATNVRDVAAAEQLALAAYRYGDVNAARRWLKVARDTPVSLWLQAKLKLRDGKVEEAASILSRVSRSFPLAPHEPARNQRAPFQDSLYTDRAEAEFHSGAEQLWGELGAIQLARREYTEALNALLRANFWEDAAYVAERVLTLDELKAFVDRYWAETDKSDTGKAKDLSEAERIYEENLANIRERVRHLLARRLTRNSRGGEARSYFPSKFRPGLDELTKALDAAYDESKSAGERAEQFIAASRVARHQGMELLATELDPDFAVYGGAYERSLSPQDRLPGHRNPDSPEEEASKANVLYASEDEIRRVRDYPADPPQRFHYRYVAAELAWMGAALLPNDSEAKARALCEAGTWIKYLNPPAADRFYKELVRKCRHTDIGQWADHIRWFPLLEENGKLREKQPRPPGQTQNSVEPVAQPNEQIQTEDAPEEPQADQEP